MLSFLKGENPFTSECSNTYPRDIYRFIREGKNNENKVIKHFNGPNYNV